jgi:hypothetical protein
MNYRSFVWCFPPKNSTAPQLPSFDYCCLQVSDSAVFDTDVVTSLRSPHNKL